MISAVSTVSRLSPQVPRAVFAGPTRSHSLIVSEVGVTSRDPDSIGCQDSLNDWHGGSVRLHGMLRAFTRRRGAGLPGRIPADAAQVMQAFGESNARVLTTIVLAEDDADLRALYAECLRREGHVVWEACDGGEALSLVRAHLPGLLLLDIWMPVLNGLEVLEHLGRTSQAVGLKVIILSHLSDADTRLEGFALGVDDYWTKDLSLADLCTRIQRLMGLSPIPPPGKAEG
jgi:CheY-like chemotaxis protein